MTRGEAIDKDKKVCLNPHATRAEKNRAITRLTNNGIKWTRILTWLGEGRPSERTRCLDILANPRASEAQTHFAAKRLFETGMPYPAIDVWVFMHREPETFSRVFRRVAKKMPHILQVSAGE